jgi:hypothetical protein
VARLYANENFPFPVVEELRRLGHDVLTTEESGHSYQAVRDELVLEFAVNDDRAVLTMNRRHFIRLHSERHHHAGIIACTVDPEFAGQAQRIHQAIEDNDELHGRLIRVNRPSP